MKINQLRTEYDKLIAKYVWAKLSQGQITWYAYQHNYKRIGFQKYFFKFKCKFEFIHTIDSDAKRAYS